MVGCRQQQDDPLQTTYSQPRLIYWHYSWESPSIKLLQIKKLKRMNKQVETLVIYNS